MNYEKGNKNMTLDDRIEIQECLNRGIAIENLNQSMESIGSHMDSFKQKY